VLPITGAGTGWVENQTINGFVNRLLSTERIELRPDDGQLRLLTYAVALGLTLLTAYLTRPGAIDAARGYGLWVVTMLLVLPAAWMHYHTIALLPLFLAAVETRAAGGLSWRRAICYGLAWALLAHGNMWTFFDRTLHGPFWQLILSYKFYGMLLLYTAIAARPVQRQLVGAALQPQRGTSA
jgi:hypothetical protein